MTDNTSYPPIDPQATTYRLIQAWAEATAKAVDSLSRGKLEMFGYWASKERSYAKLLGRSKPSPWHDLVVWARTQIPTSGAKSPVEGEPSCAEPQGGEGAAEPVTSPPPTDVVQRR